jgi:hypothetical protein
VVSAPTLRDRTSGQARNHAPSYGDLRASGERHVGERLPQFMAYEVLGCREGYVVDPEGVDPGLARIFNQRTAPIAAAVRIEINLGRESPIDR